VEKSIIYADIKRLFWKRLDT